MTEGKADLALSCGCVAKHEKNVLRYVPCGADEEHVVEVGQMIRSLAIRRDLCFFCVLAGGSAWLERPCGCMMTSSPQGPIRADPCEAQDHAELLAESCEKIAEALGVRFQFGPSEKETFH